MQTPPLPALTVLLGLSSSLLLAGCGAVPTDQPAAALGAAIQGRVIGGEQPITGAAIQLYAVGNSGNGLAASLIPFNNSVTSGAGGTFNISSDYSCPTPSNTPVYLTATGGNPGLSGTVDNTYIALVAALGPCNNLSGSTNIIVNEVTTVAAAWALAPFATSLTHIGATGTNFTGITNAFTLADQLANTATGQSPNPSLPANSIVESAKLNSLADVIASCVSSNGTGSPCSSLFTDVGIAPSDTFSAALAVVKHPGTSVGTIYNLGTTMPPFPGLSSAPNDWTMTITYPTLTGPLTGFTLDAFDSQGNLWGFVSNNTLTSFSRSLNSFTAGVSVPLYPAADGNYYAPDGALALDASNDVWFTNQVVYGSSGPSGAYLENGGSVLEYNSSGTLLSASPGYTSGGILDPQAIAMDSNGNAWIGNSGTVPTSSGDNVDGGDVALLNNSGTAISPSTGYQETTTFNPTSVAIDSNHTAWFSNYEYNTNCLSCGYVTSITTPSSGSPTINKLTIPDQYAYSVAVGTGNNVWFTSAPRNGGGTGPGATKHLGEITSGSLVADNITGGGLTDAFSMQVDPSNNIWIAGYNILDATYVGPNPFYPLMLSEFNGSGTAVSPSTGNGGYGGYGGDNNLTVRNFYPLINDSSGSLWVSGTSYLYDGDTEEIDGITVFVGLTTPVKTPQTGPPLAP
jgi:hypothetical protein